MFANGKLLSLAQKPLNKDFAVLMPRILCAVAPSVLVIIPARKGHRLAT